MPTIATYRCGVRAEQIAEEFPVVSMDSDALEAVRLLATRRLPGLVVTDQAGTPVTILPASQVVRLLVPAYVQEDPSLAGVLSESIADRIADKLGGKSVAAVLPKPPPEMATVKSDDTLIEVAAIMARQPLSPGCRHGRRGNRRRDHRPALTRGGSRFALSTASRRVVRWRSSR